MRILLLHPEDTLPGPGRPRWDLVVDLALAPHSAYERRMAQSGSRVLSLYDYADDKADLRALRELIEAGMNALVDRFAIDWWDLLSVMISPDLHTMLLARRLAQDLGGDCEICASRPHPAASALRAWRGKEIRILQDGWRAAATRLKGYGKTVSDLPFRQLKQIAADKFDSRHRWRRRFAPAPAATVGPCILLPTAYENTSRMAAAFARMLPDHRFLLACGRDSGRVDNLPPNVREAALDAYFPAPSAEQEKELSHLLLLWSQLRARLARTAPEYEGAEQAGVLARMPGLLRWGLALRDAWLHLFEREEIAGCLSADDSNPYSRLPLVLAQQRGLPAIACHHGAFDQRTAFKRLHCDAYLAKSEMERDYLVRVCGLPLEKIAMGGPPAASVSAAAGKADALVWFSEPYEASSWRAEEIYPEIAPALSKLARAAGLKLVVKLHPFESARQRRRLLRRCLSPAEFAGVQVVTGPMSDSLWRRVRCGITVESTVAVECATRGIPVLLLGWLKSYRGAYQEQLARFGAGELIASVEQLQEVPPLPAGGGDPRKLAGLHHAINPADLRRLLAGVGRRFEPQTLGAD